MEVAGLKVEEKDAKCPLRIWNSSVQKLTCVKKNEDLEPVYKSLSEGVNEVWYDNLLSKDPSLFLDSDPGESYSEYDEEVESTQ